jgi:hypothetical protein
VADDMRRDRLLGILTLERITMKIKSSQLLAAVAWISVFFMGWLIVLRKIPSDLLTWIVFTLFFVVAVFASALSRGSKNE